MTDQEDKAQIILDQDCDEGCPVRLAADVFEGKWTTQIIRDLLPGARRYSELQKGLSGISPKILTERLKMLERKGLLHKTIYPTIPPKTEYELTPLGKDMEQVIAAMAKFGVLLGQADGEA